MQSKLMIEVPDFIVREVERIKQLEAEIDAPGFYWNRDFENNLQSRRQMVAGWVQVQLQDLPF